MAVKQLFVVGAGTMGSGIAQTAAVAGYQVTMMDVAPEVLEKAKAGIAKSVDKLLARERISQAQHDAALAIATTSQMADIAGAELAIEAATENPGLKFQIFKQMDEMAQPGTILASNTSSISLDELAAATTRPQMVAGMHFFNPVPLMQLLEVVQGAQTSQATLDIITEVGQKMGKTPVVVKDSPGFIANRILCPMLNEAVFALEAGIADEEGIDTIMKLGAGHPMGPLALADMIGLDVLLSIMEVLHHDLADDKYRPAPLLQRMVAEGKLGRKSGQGFFNYS